MTLLLAVVAGALIGLSLGALGGGGSILAVPVLVYAARARAPHRPPPVPWSWSALTSLISAVAAYRAGNVLLGRGVAFGVVAIGGAAAGAKPSTHVPEPVLLAAFALLMLVVGGLMASGAARDGTLRADRELQPIAGSGVPPTPTGAADPHRRWTTRSSPSARPSPASARAP